MAYSGLRIGEVSALTVGQVNFDRQPASFSVIDNFVEISGEAQLNRTEPKSWAAREVPLSARAREAALEMAKGKKPGDFLFTPEGVQLIGSRARLVLEQACKAGGIPRTTPHNLRDTCASLLIRTGTDVLGVSKVLDHGSAVITLERYAVCFKTDTQQMIERLDAAVLEAAAEQVLNDGAQVPNTPKRGIRQKTLML